ncbi:DUF3870 domain-containing protein [Bacillus sp. FJAT-44742]|uniref:DUF3870 domain-containing protein n=1 Tax=Bacillus sp. FJAT-44742 TaxID=2014005 RepID=UPI000C23EB1E|nr:DUF3870 domain-containing protein [Bacillus sp. FJAT-44742]
MENGNIAFIAGHARLPEGMAAQSVFNTLTVTAEVDRKYGVILQASCTLATEHGREYIHHLLRGYSLKDSVEIILRAVETHYHGKAKNAILAAIKDLHIQFHTHFLRNK